MRRPRFVWILALAIGTAGLVGLLTTPLLTARSPRRPFAAAPRASVDGRATPPETDFDGSELRPSERRSALPAAGASREAVSSAEGTLADVDPSAQAATYEELLEFRAYVDATLAEMRSEEAAERFQRLQRRAGRLDDTMRELEARLSLTPAQSDELRTAILAQLDRETEYVRQWEQGADEEILSELRSRDPRAARERAGAVPLRRPDREVLRALDALNAPRGDPDRRPPLLGSVRSPTAGWSRSGTGHGGRVAVPPLRAKSSIRPWSSGSLVVEGRLVLGEASRELGIGSGRHRADRAALGLDGGGGVPPSGAAPARACRGSSRAPPRRAPPRAGMRAEPAPAPARNLGAPRASASGGARPRD